MHTQELAEVCRKQVEGMLAIGLDITDYILLVSKEYDLYSPYQKITNSKYPTRNVYQYGGNYNEVVAIIKNTLLPEKTILLIHKEDLNKIECFKTYGFDFRDFKW